MNNRPQGTKEANGLKSLSDFSPFANAECGMRNYAGSHADRLNRLTAKAEGFDTLLQLP